MTATPSDITAAPNAIALSAERALAVAAFVFLLVGYYVEPPLEISRGIVIPAASIVLLLPVLLVAVIGRIESMDVRFLGGAVLVFAVSALLSPGLAEIGQKVLGLAQTVTSLVAGIVLLKVMDSLPQRTISRLLAIGWTLLLVGVVLEIAGPLRPLVNRFGETIYGVGGYEFYSGDLRDLDLVGFARPKFFTSEPSLAAIGFMMLTNSWLCIKPTLRRTAIVMTCTVVAIPLFGSLVLVLSLFVSMLIGGAATRRFRTILLAGALAVIIVIIGASIFPAVARAFQNRGQQGLLAAAAGAGPLELTSENLRLVIPAITTFDVLSHSPLFGVGISGKEVIIQYSTLPFRDFVTEVRIGNNLALLLIYLGIVGASAYLWLWRWYARRLQLPHVGALLVLALGLSQCMGGFETPRFWGYVFLAVGALRAGARSTFESDGARSNAAVSSAST